MSLPVQKTYKNFVGGVYVRPESGRTKDFLGSRVPVSSRKDLRQAVEAANKATVPASAYLRGQIVYRLAEMLSARKQEFIDYLKMEGLSQQVAEQEIELAIDRVVLMAGWADKYSQILSSINAVEGPYFVSTAPEPKGICVLAAPADPGLTILLTRMLAAFVTGNPAVVLFESSCLSRLALAELIQASDFPQGTINLLCGQLDELLPVAAAHKQIALLDLSLEISNLSEFQEIATSNLKRLIIPTAEQLDPASSQSASVSVLNDFCEQKTVWHPLGF